MFCNMSDVPNLKIIILGYICWIKTYSVYQYNLLPQSNNKNMYVFDIS